jgi:hypothetical protein
VGAELSRARVSSRHAGAAMREQGHPQNARGRIQNRKKELGYLNILARKKNYNSSRKKPFQLQINRIYFSADKHGNI